MTIKINTLADARRVAIALLEAMPELTHDDASDIRHIADRRAYLDAATAAYHATDDALAALNDATRALERSQTALAA